MSRRYWWVVALLAAIALPASTLAQGRRRHPSRPALQPIAYHVTGGFAPIDRWVRVSAAGVVQTYDLRMASSAQSGREQRVREKGGRLNAAEAARLACAFARWGRLADRYVPPRPVPDGRTEELTYGRKRVVAADGAAIVPAQFRAAVQALLAAAERATGRPARR